MNQGNLENNRFNDAKCDAKGRLWAGTMDFDVKTQSGNLYCLDNDLKISLKDSNYWITNGPSWSVDNKYLYHITNLLALTPIFIVRMKTDEVSAAG